MPITSPLKKRPSAGGGGRLRRLLASLRPPARPGPLPVQTGFPTSIADIVVKHHGRFKIPRRQRRAAATAEPTTPVPQSQQERRELSVAHGAAAPAPAPVTARSGRGVGFSIRPGVMAAGGAVALVLLVIWSKQLVAAATLASVALSLIESARTGRASRPETEEVVVDLDSLPTILETAESTTRPSRAECDSGSGDADSGDLGRDDDDSSSASSSVKRKQRRRSLRKLLANKLRGGRTPRSTESRHGGDAGELELFPAETPRRLNAAAVPADEETPTPAPVPEAITDEDRCGRRRRGGELLLPVLVPIILAGLVAGKLPALALAVLCAAFSSSSVET